MLGDRDTTASADGGLPYAPPRPGTAEFAGTGRPPAPRDYQVSSIPARCHRLRSRTCHGVTARQSWHRHLPYGDGCATVGGGVTPLESYADAACSPRRA